MRYLILIYENEATTPQDESEFQKWMEYPERLKTSGALLGGEALQPTSTATTVRVKDGKVSAASALERRGEAPADEPAPHGVGHGARAAHAAEKT